MATPKAGTVAVHRSETGAHSWEDSGQAIWNNVQEDEQGNIVVSPSKCANAVDFWNAKITVSGIVGSLEI